MLFDPARGWSSAAGALDRLFTSSLHQADDDLVFGHPELGSVLDASKLRKRFKATLAAAGVRPVRFHDLRHTFGTQAAASGVPLRTLDAIHTAACDLSQDFPFCTTDKRMRDAAHVLGIPVFPADESPTP